VEEPKTVRSTNPASKLRDADNVQQAELSFQHRAVEDFHTRMDQDLPAEVLPLPASSQPASHPDTPESTPLNLPKRPIAEIVSVDDESDEDTQPKRGR
jgi:hypothetical protein